MNTLIDYITFTKEHWVLSFKLPDNIYTYFKERTEQSNNGLLNDPDNVFMTKIFCGLFDSEYGGLFKNRIGDNPWEATITSLKLKQTKENDIDLLHDNNGLFSFRIWMNNSPDLFTLFYPYEDEKSRSPLLTVKTYNVPIKSGNCIIFPNYLQSMGFYNNNNKIIMGNIS